MARDRRRPARRPGHRHLPRRRVATSAARATTASSRTTSATASAPRCTCRPTCPTSAGPGAGPSWSQGLALAVEPMVTLGDQRDRRRSTTTGPSSPPTARWAAHFEHTFTLTPERRLGAHRPRRRRGRGSPRSASRSAVARPGHRRRSLDPTDRRTDAMDVPPWSGGPPILVTIRDPDLRRVRHRTPPARARRMRSAVAAPGVLHRRSPSSSASGSGTSPAASTAASSSPAG